MPPDPPQPAAAESPTGRTLGDFAIKDKLGEGGFGAVFRAQQVTLGREAVVKILHAQHHSSPQTVQRFLREARLASKLDHPYAAHIYAFGAESDGLMWIAMELVRGTPLNRVLKSQGALPLDRFVPLLDRVCEVVHTAHEQGIIHRDIKPANVMVLSRAGRLLPKLLDFGIGKFADGAGEEAAAPLAERSFDGSGESTLELAEEATGVDDTPGTPGTTPTGDGAITELGVAMGSPPYMAPEQWTNAALADARTDVYALGVMAYECLAGRAPFLGDVGTVARAHARKAVPKLGGDFPAALDAVIARAMAKRKADRYPTALAFAAAFRDASGVAGEVESLPRLEESLRQSVLVYAPQPIAEAVAILDAARNPHQARDAAWEVVRTVVRYIGLLSLACRSRAGSGGDGDAPAVTELLLALRRRDLHAQEWLQLARGLMRPFAGKRDAYPVPELVSLFFAVQAEGEPPQDSRLADTLLRLADLRDTDDGGTLDDQVRDRVARLLPELATLLGSVAFLYDYRLVVPKGDRAEDWMGTRKLKRATVALARPLPPNQPLLVSFEGRPVVALWPLVQVSSPSPGTPEEMFFFEGRGRRGARLAALPLGFEIQDEAVWDWLRDHLLVSGEAGETPAASERAPYRGLSAFTRDDRDLFFGRERQVEAFVNRLRVHALLAVVGPSGAGKSSFVQAGVVPALTDWRVITVRPGPAPVSTLLARLRHEEIAIEDVHTLGDTLRQAASPFTGPILLVVDQLEELFTLCGDPAERDLYTEAIVKAARSPEDNVRVVLTLRDDFLVRAERLPALRDRLAQGLQLLATPAPEDLARIIVEPARRAGYDFDDPELPALMVADVAEQPGALALLSFTAAQLWELRDRHFKQLPRTAYEAMGGVGGALARHAEATLASMPAEEQKLVREAFRHLVTAEGTRAVLTRAELRQVLGGAGGAETVIEKLVAARLLTASEEDHIEVVHEALLAAWPRLVDWRRDDAEGARLRDQLRAAARQWEDRGRPRGLLWRAEALAEYQLWRARYPGALTESEEAFGKTSLADAARGKRIRGAVVATIMVALAAGIVVLLRANGVARTQRQRAEVSEHKSERLLVDSYEEQGRQAYLRGDAATALVYLAEAYRDGADDAVVGYGLAHAIPLVTAQQLTLLHDDSVYSARYSPDGTRIVTASYDRTAKVWDAATGRLLLTLGPHRDIVTSASFDRDGARIATSSWDGTARLWDARSGALLHALEGHGDRVFAVAFSPDGALAATASRDTTARVWDAASGRLVATLTGHGKLVAKAVFSPDGELLATAGDDGSVKLWRPREGTLVRSLEAHSGKIWSVAFSRRGDRLLTAGDRTAKLWRVADGAPLATLNHGAAILHAELDPTDTRVVTSLEDGSALVWDAGTGRQLRSLVGHAGAVWYAGFSPNGQAIVTTSRDHTARLWDAASGTSFAVYSGHGESLWMASFDPSGAHLVTASRDHTAKVWSTADQQRLATMDLGAAGVFADFAPDDRLLATTDAANHLRLWTAAGAPAGDLAFPEELTSVRFLPDGARLLVGTAEGVALVTVAPLAVERRHQLGYVNYAEASPDGKRLLAASLDKKLVLLDAADGRKRWTIDLAGAPYMAAFSHDGARIVAGLDDNSVSVFPAGGGAALLRIKSDLVIESVEFTPDDHAIIASSGDKASVYDAATGRIVTSLLGHVGDVRSATTTRDGRLIVTSGLDHTARVWEAASGRPLATLASHSKAVIFAAVSHDGQRVATVGEDGLVHVWDLSLNHRSPAEVTAIVDCFDPLQLVNGQVLLRPTRSNCPPNP